MIHSIAGIIAKGALTRDRPFRAPHHSASMAALTGGGLRVKPGEISLAHNGVLFLDELPEFGAQALDSLRQPLETGEVIVARANAHVRYPARVQLVAAMNPCRCGHGGFGRGACGKAPNCQQAYQGRISGPLLDRIDLTVEVPPVTSADLTLPPPSEGTAEVAVRVATARRLASSRAEDAGNGAAPLNARADGEWLETISALDQSGRSLLIKAAETSAISARGWTRTLRLARTIADLDQSPSVRRVHIAEALLYRRAMPGGEAGPPRTAASTWRSAVGLKT
jgi:magnesium chelatase family protein